MRMNIMHFTISAEPFEVLRLQFGSIDNSNGEAQPKVFGGDYLGMYRNFVL